MCKNNKAINKLYITNTCDILVDILTSDKRVI